MRCLGLLLFMSWAHCLFCQEVPATLDGRVLNSVTGEPVGGASVHLFAIRRAAGGGRGANDTQTTSLADGSFHFENISPGTYELRAQHGGFSSMPHTALRSALDLASGQAATDATVTLIPDVTLSGTVSDDAGAPVPGVHISVFARLVTGRQNRFEQRASADSDASGKFTLKDLKQGNYFLAAEPGAEKQPANDSGELVRTFFPHSLDLEEAAAIPIVAGQTPQAVTITLRRAFTHHVRGKVPDMAFGRDWRVIVSSRHLLGLDSLAHGDSVAKDGTFDICGVLPGAYTLKLVAGRMFPLANQDVDVDAQDVNGIVLNVLPTVTLDGKITVEGAIGNTGPRLQVLAAMLEGRKTARANVHPDGTFQFQDLNPALFVFRVVVLTPGLYVHSLKFNQQEAKNRAIDLAGISHSTLDVVLRSGTGEIDGRLTNDTSGLAKGLVLVPDEVAPDGSNISQRYSLADGTFAFPNVPPGDYQLYALPPQTWAMQPVLWLSPEFLKAVADYGVGIKLEENQHQQTQIAPVPQELLEQTADQLGLTWE